MDLAKASFDTWVKHMSLEDDLILWITEDKRHLKRELEKTLKVCGEAQRNLDAIKKSLSEVESNVFKILPKFENPSGVENLSDPKLLPKFENPSGVENLSDPDPVPPPSQVIDTAFIHQHTKMLEEFNAKVKFEKDLIIEVAGLNSEVRILTTSMDAVIRNISDLTLTLKDSCSDLAERREAASLRMSDGSNREAALPDASNQEAAPPKHP